MLSYLTSKKKFRQIKACNKKKRIIFDKIREQSSHQCTAVWKLRKFTLTRFWQKFRESNGFTIKVTRVDLTKYYFGVSQCGNYGN